jgi:hypothetical protein
MDKRKSFVLLVLIQLLFKLYGEYLSKYVTELSILMNK